MENTDYKITSQELEQLGLTSAAKKLDSIKEFNRKVSIAYEHFRYVRKEQFDRFNTELREKTESKTKEDYKQYDRLQFIQLQLYTEIPPTCVLEKLKEAKVLNCFDFFEIAKIESHVERPDPILFGCVNNCPDKFFISQWDMDISIEDLLKENEG